MYTLQHTWHELELAGRITSENPLTDAHVEVLETYEEPNMVGPNIADAAFDARQEREAWNAHIERLVREAGPVVGLAATLRIDRCQLPCTVVTTLLAPVETRTPTVAVQLDTITETGFVPNSQGEIYWLYWAAERERYMFRDRSLILGVRCFYRP